MKIVLPDGTLHNGVKCEACKVIVAVNKQNRRKITIGRTVTDAVECANCGAFVTEKPFSPGELGKPQPKKSKRKYTKKGGVKKKMYKYFQHRKVVKGRSRNFILNKILGRHGNSQDIQRFKELEGILYKKENCAKNGRGMKCDWVSLIHTPEESYSPDLKEDNEYWKDLQR